MSIDIAPESVKEFLISIDQSFVQYLPKLEEAGYNKLNFLKNLNEKAMDKLSIPLGHQTPILENAKILKCIIIIYKPKFQFIIPFKTNTN